jgi:osmoprotectant transport system ATP-binding protein
MITFEKLTKTYPGGVHAVSNVSMEVKEGETLVLLGTSGSGKTTTLKMVNRLIEPTGGRILIDGKDIMSQDPITLRRNIGYAIQHIGLFPHMTVGENIAVVPKLLKWPKEKINKRIDNLLNIVGLPAQHFRSRYPVQLSGGQRQRIGVARCLAADPPIILMDEPFGALDPITREQLQNEFISLESQIEKTILFVTHDIFEAVKMCDRIALLDKGKLQQLSSPEELVENPVNEFVDNFLGQHRVQLALLTHKVKEVIIPSRQPLNEQKKSDFIYSKATLLEALDVFKEKQTETLCVYRGKNYLGILKKSELLNHISSVLGKVGQ